MGRPDPRRFTATDGKVLMGATAAGLAATWGIFFWRDGLRGFAAPDGGWTALNVLRLVPRLVYLGTPIPVAWTLAALGLHLRRPRPRLRRLILRPGMAACTAASAAVVLELLLPCAAALWFRSQREGWLSTVFHLPETLGRVLVFRLKAPGIAVLTAWAAVLRIAGWRPEPNWIDRVGRLLGAWWIAMILLHAYMMANFWANFQ